MNDKLNKIVKDTYILIDLLNVAIPVKLENLKGLRNILDNIIRQKDCLRTSSKFKEKTE